MGLAHATLKRVTRDGNKGVEMDSLAEIVRLALAEDVGTGDITTLTTVASDRQASGVFLAKAGGVLSGTAAAQNVFAQVDPAVAFVPRILDGSRFEPGAHLATVRGPARGILTGERVALNFLQRLSGVATATARYVEAVSGTNARIIDTRKTTPGMRLLEKAAVRHGGGFNHRVGLSDGVLIKDNHLAAIGTNDRIRRAIEAARLHAPHTLKIEVEVTTLDEVAEALQAEADVIMLDNMDLPTLREAVRLIDGRALIEASGGITLESVSDVAATGVDLISVGALTHSSPALDISLEISLNEEFRS
jgi:nicotinate-nucleotide pyrophosphorylase (carboxylating)